MDKFELKNRHLDLSLLAIYSERLLLKSITFDFASDIFKEFTEEVTRYMMPKPAESISDTEAFISQSIEAMQRQKEVVLVILDAKTDEFLGCCGLHGRGEFTTPELGIWLKKSAHGHKYGLEAIRALTDWAVSNMVFEYAIYPVDKENIPSRRIPEALGGTVFSEVTVTSMSGFELEEVIYKLPAKNLTNI